MSCLPAHQPHAPQESHSPLLVRQLPQRHTALEQLVNMVRFVVGHVFGLEVHIIMLVLGMTALAVPVGRRQRFEAAA